jgi:hypothetical protein
MSDPFECLSRREGYTQVNMRQAAFLVNWARNNPQFMSLFNICFNSLVSGDIVVDTGPAPKTTSTDRVQVPTAKQEAERRWRSRIVTDWSREKEFIRLCIGFVPVTGVRVPFNADVSMFTEDLYQPAVLNIDLVDIQVRTSVTNQRDWLIYERSNSRAMLTSRPMHGVKIFGHEFPDNAGNIQSLVRRVYDNAYAPYMSKVVLTIQADERRANPRVTMQSRDQHDNQKNVMPSFESMLDIPAMERTPAALAVHAQVAAKNSGCGDVDMAPVTRKRNFNQLRIPEGQEYVNATIAEAPAETLSFSQAFLETMCLEFGVPMSMISSGDASGKAKLNSESAGPETARIFREAQAQRKRQVESDIAMIYTFMWCVQDLKRKCKELNRVPEPKEIDEAMQVRVSIPANPPIEQIIQLWKDGIVKYSSMCTTLSNQMCMGLDNFNTKASIDIKDLAGIAPPEKEEAGAGAAKPKAKKAKTTSKKK